MDKCVYMYCGVPGSGKDYLAEKTPNSEIVSFDNIRIDLWKKEQSQDTLDKMSDKEIYNEAWEWCKENRINLMGHMMKQIKHIFDTSEKYVCICNTNLTRKARRKIINSLWSFKNYKIEIICVYVLVPYKDIINRNLYRSSHTVPMSVIEQMCLNQHIPTLYEGFDSVSIINNNIVGEEYYD